MGATLIDNDPELDPVSSDTHLQTSDGRRKVGLAARGDRWICWYDLYGKLNPGHSHGSTMVYPICYSYCTMVYPICCSYFTYTSSKLTLTPTFLVKICLDGWDKRMAG